MSVTSASTMSPGGTSTVWPLPSTTTDTVEVCPSTVSVTVQVAGVAMLSYCWVLSPAGVPAGITKSGVSALPLHSLWMTISP